MHTDVLVLGAGPAGSALARQLAAAGVAVVLADRQDFPRRKPCGEFLSPQCQPLLAALGLGDLLQALGAHEVRSMRLHAADTRAEGTFRRLPDRAAPATGFGIRREVFDHALVRGAEAMGARLLPRHAFVDLLRDGARVAGATLRDREGRIVGCRARWVVGADGVHSRVARALGVQRPISWLDQFALTTHFEGVAPQPTAEVHLLRGGFFAATSVDGGRFSVNLVLPRRAFRQRDGASWDGFVGQQAEVEAPAFRARLASGTRAAPWRGTGPLAFRTTTQTAPGAALIGDAAGYVDPLTGEGVYFALFTARALGDALSTALATPRQAELALAGYRSARRRELGPRLWAAKLLQRGLRSPFVVQHCLGALRRWPALADLAVTLSGDAVHPRELWRPGFWRDFRGAAS